MVVTAMVKGVVSKQEFGWRHQALRASFIHLPNGLFLKLSPTYMLTKEDGKTPRGGAHVGAALACRDGDRWGRLN